MSTIASLITSLTIVYLTVYSDADQRKHQSPASLAFVRGIHRRPVNSPHKWPVTRKMFPFDDVIMLPRFLSAAGPWYSQCSPCMAPSCMIMAGPATGGYQGVAQLECRGPRWNSAKRSCLPWISTNGSLQLRQRYRNTMRCHAVAGHRKVRDAYRDVFDALRVRPMGLTWRGYLVLSFRGYQRFDQWLQLLYPPPESLLHAVVEHRSHLLCLSGAHTAIQTPRTVEIYGQRFRNSWFDCHETWQKWSRGVNFEV